MVAQGMSGNMVRIFILILNIFTIMTAFFGAFLGFCEALQGLTMNILRRILPEERINKTMIKYGVFAVVILLPWYSILINFSIVKFIHILGPIYGLVNCLIPTYLVYKVPFFAKFKHASLALVVLAGCMFVAAPLLAFL